MTRLKLEDLADEKLVRLIPPMIERFIATGRSYAKTRREAQPGKRSSISLKKCFSAGFSLLSRQ